MKKCLIASLILLLPASAMAQEGWNIVTSGGFKAGVQAVDNTNNSSKFNEYRDIDDGVYLYDLNFETLDKNSGLFLELGGKNISRDDESARLGIGSYGTWRLQFDRNEIPHNISNKAMTPFIERGDGLYTVATPAVGAALTGYPNRAADAAIVRATDSTVSGWLTRNLHEIDLGTERDKNSVELTVTPNENFKFRLSYSDENKDGSKITYGPIGPRPPDSLNIQMAEPIDYQTRELKFEAEYNNDWFQSLFAYTVSDFSNGTDALTWQNIWASAADVNDLGGYMTFTNSLPDSRRVATFGQRSLYPDNQYQNVSLSLGVDLPMNSRLAGTIAYGLMEQDETLLPYSTSNFGVAARTLPRTKADAEIETTLFNFEYTIKPIDRLQLRAFYRHYDLDNNTEESQWNYVTSDATSGTGTSSYKNRRNNLAYAYEQQNYGLDASYSMNLWRTTLGLEFEREEIERDYREGDTDENIYTASIRTRPADWVTLRVKYLYGDREGSSYDNSVTSQSYWYEPVNANDADNPKYTFSNHPDMRKFDVIDRERNQLDLAATFMPTESLNLTASYRWQDDDYDSDVNPVQPLAGTGFATANGVTPGDQLGLLERETERYSLDASYAATERLNLNAFWSYENIDSKQRGLEFDENYKAVYSNASGNSLTKDLGSWTEARGQWVAKTEDRTNTVGAGTSYEIIPGKLNFIADYIFSYGKVDIDYSGFGAPDSGIRTAGVTSTNPRPDTNEFAFRDTPTVTHKQYTLNATLEYQVVKNLIIGLHYMFDRYSIDDWMQEDNTSWFGAVDGNEYILRDSSASHQWGNRLVNMGSYLGPSYESHTSFLTLTYKF